MGWSRMFEYLVPVNLALFSIVFSGIYLYQRHLIYARWLAIAYASGMAATIFDIINPHSEIARLDASDISHPLFWSVGIFVLLGMAHRYRQDVPHMLIRAMMVAGVAAQLVFGYYWYHYPLQETASNLLAAGFMFMAAQMVQRGGTKAMDAKIAWLLRVVALSFLVRITVVFAPLIFGSGDYLQIVDMHNALQLIMSSVASVGAALAFLVMSAQDIVDIYRIQSRTDALTGLLNRRGWEERIDALVAADSLNGRILLICDLDHFKEINDRFGHHAGDLVLQRAGASLAHVKVPGSEVARIGGEEFALLLPQECAPAMDTISELVRQSVGGINHAELDGRPVTCSIGCAAIEADGGYRGAYLQADTALYAAKRHGRNRVAYAATEMQALARTG
jgi:diguanylate cyclase (GGDEF)-like protein